WMKVGDPRNGTTGWIKSQPLTSKTGVTSFRFKTMTNDASSPITYHFFQSGTDKMTEQQQQDLLKELQARQQLMQKNMQMMFQNFDSMNHAWGPMPVMMPVVFVPVHAEPKAETSTSIKPPQQNSKGKEVQGKN